MRTLIAPLSIVFLSLFSVSVGHARVYIYTLDLLVTIQEASHQGELSRADSLCRLLISETPDRPAGYYARAVQYQVKNVGCTGMWPDSGLVNDIQRAVERGEHIVMTAPDDAWNRYFLGLALGMQAVLNVQKGHLWRGWRTSGRSLEHLNAALELDSTLQDALMPIGAYHFWRGETLKNWSWLPFIDDTREQGLQQMRRAAKYGTTTRTSAISMMVWALLQSHRHEEALGMMDSMLVIYPRNRSFLWARAEALKALGRWSEARVAFRTTVETFEPEHSRCPGLINLRAKEAMAMVELGDCDNARPILRECLNYDPPKAYQRKTEELKKEVMAYLERCRKASTSTGKPPVSIPVKGTP